MRKSAVINRVGSFEVIPAQAGIQWFYDAKNQLDPGFHRGDGKNSILSKHHGKKGVR